MIKFLDDQITHELLLASSININFFQEYAKILKSRDLSHEDFSFFNPSFLVTLFQFNLVTEKEISEYLPANFLHPEKLLESQKSISSNFYLNSHSPIAVAIENDEVEKLSFYASHSWFSCNQMLKIEDKLYNYSFIPLLHYSIQCSSFNCMKFLLLNGADPNLKSRGTTEWDAMAFAAAQEKMVMIQTLEIQGSFFNTDTIDAAAKFHQNALLFWLHENQEVSLKFTLFKALEFNNLEALIYCINSGSDINAMKSYNI